MLTLLGGLFVSSDCVFVVAPTDKMLCHSRSKLVGDQFGNSPGEIDTVYVHLWFVYSVRARPGICLEWHTIYDHMIFSIMLYVFCAQFTKLHQI